MSVELIHDALNDIDDGLIEKTNLLRQGKRRPRPMWLRWGALAACLCMVMAGAWMLRGFSGGSTGSSIMKYAANDSAAGDPNSAMDIEVGAEAPDTPAEAPAAQSEITVISGVSIPRMEVDLYRDSDPAADMELFFIYQGRSYVQYAMLENVENLVGEQLGTATGLINEWTSEDGYVELAGSYNGPFYEVAGYDPSFMLCAQMDDGTVQIFINNNDITLFKGNELFEDRLHMTGNIDRLEYDTHYSWYSGAGDLCTVPGEYAQTLDRFLVELNESEFVYRISQEVDRSACYHLYFHMNDGMRIDLMLNENGIVRFRGMDGIAVRIDTHVADELVRILK